MGSTWKKVVRAMTFSDHFAHSLSLFSYFRILKHDDIYDLSGSSFVCECHNNLAPNHFRDYLTQVSDIHQYNTQSASNGTFLQKEHFIFIVWLTLFVLKEQKFVRTSLLISKTLHFSWKLEGEDQTIASGVFIIQKIVSLFGTLYQELGINVLWAFCLLVHTPFGSSRL